ncbi:bestrophin family protein [Rhodomicrobium lacus]|uniref:bestrophin family protein n=1 Tax=Rhodomicrobium lacus TaxID=2498452 RepID=UPI0026E17FA7|nr:bestrophin family protein [Rhodomicrobium lacus]WKW50871.1 bestrophin family protein [Rhodomicrobium lacus]
MIVRKSPNMLAMLFTLRGTVVIQIWQRLLIVAAVSTFVAVFPHVWSEPLPSVSLAPFSLIGLVLSIFLGFRNNACYDRWWEARKQWGHLIAQSRALAREARALHDPAVAERIARRSIGFAAVLAARLRGQDEAAALRPWLSEAEAVAVLATRNRPQAVLQLLTVEIVDIHRRGNCGEILLRMLEDRVEEMNAIQTACERIKNTPAPFAYSLLLHRTSWIFCLVSPFGLWETCGLATPLFTLVLAYAFFGLDAVGDELEEPFGLLPNGLPLNAMVRTIEIDLLETIGAKEIPEPLQPVDGWLLT